MSDEQIKAADTGAAALEQDLTAELSDEELAGVTGGLSPGYRDGTIAGAQTNREKWDKEMWNA